MVDKARALALIEIVELDHARVHRHAMDAPAALRALTAAMRRCL